MSEDSISVLHDLQGCVFYVDTPKGRASLIYTREGDALHFNRVFVPEPLRGEGLAAKIVEAGFDYAKSNEFKVVPACPYVQKFVREHQKWKTFVIE